MLFQNIDKTRGDNDNPFEQSVQQTGRCIITGYTRLDVGNAIANGQPTDATYLDLEFDGIVAAFNSSSGHSHNGGVGEGAPITNLGPAQDLVASGSVLRPKTTNIIDLGTDGLRFKDAYFNGTIRTAAIRAVGSGTNCFIASNLPSSSTKVQYSFEGDSLTGVGRPSTSRLSLYGNGEELFTISPTGAFFNVPVSVGSVAGNAVSATRLQTARTIALSGGAVGSPIAFNGTANITIPVTSLSAPALVGTVPSSALSAGNFPTTSTAASWVGGRLIDIGSSTTTGVGMIVLAQWIGGDIGVIDFKEVIPGNNLIPCSTSGAYSPSDVFDSGSTWRCLGRINTNRTATDLITLWQRVT